MNTRTSLTDKYGEYRIDTLDNFCRSLRKIYNTGNWYLKYDDVAKFMHVAYYTGCEEELVEKYSTETINIFKSFLTTVTTLNGGMDSDKYDWLVSYQ